MSMKTLKSRSSIINRSLHNSFIAKIVLNWGPQFILLYFSAEKIDMVPTEGFSPSKRKGLL